MCRSITHMHTRAHTHCRACTSRLVTLCRVSGGEARDESRESDGKQMKKRKASLTVIGFYSGSNGELPEALKQRD